MNPSRRDFFRALGAAGVGALAAPGRIAATPQPGRAEVLNDRFPDLRRHFVFEYYPWYATNPYQHWDQYGRHPPVDLASNYMPRLGAYDSADTRVIEQHARWIADVGVGAVNLSWWGPGNITDRNVPAIMDVMAAYDIHVTFHLEPYADDRWTNYARDVQYLLKEYGDRRNWDCMLLLQNADGSVGPVFKSFGTILPPTGTDCHGVKFPVSGYAPDASWRRQTDLVRDNFRRDFDRVTLLADSLDFDRTRACGFDGIAIYDNYVKPDTYLGYATASSSRDLIFSFNVNSGFDVITDRDAVPGPCPSSAPRFEPGGASYDWSQPSDRERAAQASIERINEAFNATLAVQMSSTLSDAKHGFLLVYINSFNEWHEGHQFEPMKDSAALTADERAIGYHNPADGASRLKRLGELLDDLDL